jgi:RNA polymerase sigma-70 factor, ECF subfamily
MALAQPDRAVLRKAQRGDERAFALIVRQYELPVFNYVFRTVRNHHLAEDITQEIFLRVFQSLPRFSFQSLFTTWLFQVTKNRLIDEFRRRERRPTLVDLEDAPGLRAAEVPFDRGETIDAIWRAIGELNLDLKLALLLRDVVGLSYDEIADSLEITLATVKWRIYKAREQVQLALAAEGLGLESSEAAPDAATAT